MPENQSCPPDLPLVEVHREETTEASGRRTCDVALLVELHDAEQVRPLLLAALAGLVPGQHRQDVPLVLDPRHRVRVPVSGS